MKTESEKNRIEYISVLNVISTIAVVMLHTNGCFWNFSKERYWITANIIESVLYFAVPVFFMISGVTLLDYKKKYNTRVFFYKRIRKTVIPFIAWSLIGLIFRASKFGGNAIDINKIFPPDLSFILSGILRTSIIDIYWFFIPLFTVYLSYPLFSSVQESEKKSVFMYLAILGFILNSMMPFLDMILPIELYSGILCLDIVSGYISYTLIGYLLANFELDDWKRYFIYFTGILGVGLHICGTQILSFNKGEIVRTYKGYNNMPCVLYSVMIFILFKQISHILMSNSIVNKFVVIVNKYSFCIYLQHWFVIKLLLYVFSIDTRSIVYRIGMPFIIIPICIVISYGLKKIPVIKEIVP